MRCAIKAVLNNERRLHGNGIHFVLVDRQIKIKLKILIYIYITTLNHFKLSLNYLFVVQLSTYSLLIDSFFLI